MQNIDILGIDYIEFYVGNLFQASHFYENVLGFTVTAHLEAENTKEKTSILLKQNDIHIILTSSLVSHSNIAQHVHHHGDGVKDIAFLTKDAKATFRKALERGATAILEPTVIEDENCKIIKATIATFGDTHHSFIEHFAGSKTFLPHTKSYSYPTRLLKVGLQSIDHVAICLEKGELSKWKDFYEQTLDFHESHREDVYTENSGMNSIVLQNKRGTCVFPIIEPAPGTKKSQIREFLDAYGSAGVQHIAFSSDNIAHAIRSLRNQGIQFLSIPNSYYGNLKHRIDNLEEDLDILEELQILIDQDEEGLLFQTFSKVIQTRPTFFIEVIERRGSKGFGSRNIKALFEAIEREQINRGSLS